jgi:hypothetical protein
LACKGQASDGVVVVVGGPGSLLGSSWITGVRVINVPLFSGCSASAVDMKMKDNITTLLIIVSARILIKLGALFTTNIASRDIEKIG